MSCCNFIFYRCVLWYLACTGSDITSNLEVGQSAGLPYIMIIFCFNFRLGCGDKEIHSDPISVTLDQESTTTSGICGICCGSRHTVYWLDNGQCYSSGNNFYAQLGYDFRIKNYKDNQVC